MSSDSIAGSSTAQPYVCVSGRELFEELSITGLNRSPIEILSNYVLAGVRVTGGTPPLPPPQLVERLLVEGTLLWVGGVLQGDLRECERNEQTGLITITQEWENVQLSDSTGDVIREYRQQPDGTWQVRDYVQGSQTELMEPVNPESTVLDNLSLLLLSES